jgi:transposase
LLTGRKVNVIAAMTSEGMEITTGSVNRDRFFYFVRGSLIPMMKPLDRHSPHSVLILDNCSVHQVREVTQLLTQEGIVVLFPPPHSPDLNPIEEAFSCVKAYLRKHDELLPSESRRH